MIFLLWLRYFIKSYRFWTKRNDYTFITVCLFSVCLFNDNNHWTAAAKYMIDLVIGWSDIELLHFLRKLYSSMKSTISNMISGKKKIQGDDSSSSSNMIPRNQKNDGDGYRFKNFTTAALNSRGMPEKKVSIESGLSNLSASFRVGNITRLLSLSETEKRLLESKGQVIFKAATQGKK